MCSGFFSGIFLRGRHTWQYSWLYTQESLWKVFRGPYQIAGIELRLTACMANTLYPLLSFNPFMYSFKSKRKIPPPCKQIEMLTA